MADVASVFNIRKERKKVKREKTLHISTLLTEIGTGANYLTISDKTLLFISALLLRFPNLTSIKLHPSIGDDFNTLFTRIASSHLPLLNSLNLSHQRQHGFSSFHGKFPSLKSLNYSHMCGFSNAIQLSCDVARSRFMYCDQCRVFVVWSSLVMLEAMDVG
ncbi:hypothetical protein PIB30_013310 [Stylosanthes scabra]|uniref:Uncharacterized protein n=1 Tax=Stylosanthes scabra TaxID=79078 RepID=A0ABU6T682_9FABA|nr:hypothetical protein [Stylosanthes scabra]